MYRVQDNLLENGTDLLAQQMRKHRREVIEIKRQKYLVSPCREHSSDFRKVFP